MPGYTGKGYSSGKSATSEARLSNRTKTGKKTGQTSSSPLKRQQVLSREKALRRVKQLLQPSNGIPGEVIDLIALFHLEMDELTEAGVPYEMVRALEKRFPLIWFE